MIDPLDKEAFMDRMKASESVGNYSENAVRRFWKWMYKREDGLVQVCAFPVPTEGKDKEEMGQGKWVHARSYNEFQDFCSTHSGLWRYHVYSGVNTLDVTPDSGRGSIDHIDKVKRLSFDIETERESYSGASKKEVWWTYRYALAQAKFMLEEYGVLPLMVMSENGIHMHYRVNFDCRAELLDGKQHIYSKYITHQAMDNRFVNQVVERSPDSVVFDQDDVSDPARVMKVPGTKGIKSQQGRLCGIIHEPETTDAGIIHGQHLDIDKDDVEHLDNNKGGKTESNTPTDTSPSELDDDTISKVKRLIKNDKKFGRYWRGDISEYQSRSEAEFGFIIKMLNHNFSRQQVIEVMWASGMSKWEEESQHYRERTIEKALDYFDGTVVKDSRDGSFSF